MAAAALNFRSRPVAALALALLFVLATVVSLRAAWDRFDELLHGYDYVSPSFYLETPTFKVEGLEPEAERAGLRKGDFVINADGRPAQGWSDIYGPIQRARTGDRMRLQVRRSTPTGALERDLSVPLKQFTYVGYLP